MKMEMVDSWLEMEELVICFNVKYSFKNVSYTFLEHSNVVKVSLCL